MKRQRIFFNDLLALACACVISLLFTHGVTQFINTGCKKQGGDITVSAQQVIADEVDILYFSETRNNIKSPIEAFSNVERSFCSQTESYKIARPVIIDIALEWKRLTSQPHNLASFYRLKLPDVWSPSIPIAQRKLLI